MLSIAPNILTTQRLILRPWRETDRDGFARLNADPVVMEFMPRCLSRDESDAIAARYQAGIEERGWGFWAVEVPGCRAFSPPVEQRPSGMQANFWPSAITCRMGA